MTGTQADRELVELQQRLSALLERYDEGERSTLYAEMRMLTDEVIYLAEDAPEDAPIRRLADRCETFLRSLAN